MYKYTRSNSSNCSPTSSGSFLSSNSSGSFLSSISSEIDIEND